MKKLTSAQKRTLQVLQDAGNWITTRSLMERGGSPSSAQSLALYGSLIEMKSSDIHDGIPVTSYRYKWLNIENTLNP